MSPSFCETSLSIPSLISSAVSGFVDHSVDLICSCTSDFIVLSSASDSLLHFNMSLLTLARLLASMFDLVSGYILSKYDMRIQYYFPRMALALLGNRLLSLVCTHPLSIFVLFAFLKIIIIIIVFLFTASL